MWQLGQLFDQERSKVASFPPRYLAPAPELCGVLRATKGVPSGSTSVLVPGQFSKHLFPLFGHEFNSHCFNG